jgi:hypothetical protein
MNWKRIYLAENALEANLIRGRLEADGIGCRLEGEALSGASGDLPVDVLQMPVLVASGDAAKARQVIAEYESRRQLPEWVCQCCGEQNQASFEICWNCLAEPRSDLRKT